MKERSDKKLKKVQSEKFIFENDDLDMIKVLVSFQDLMKIVELKIWRGKKYEQEGIERLTNYIDALNEEKGYLVTFNFNHKKNYSQEWISINDKKIFSIIV